MTSLRPFQTRAVGDALQFLRGAGRDQTRMYVSPTGSGKSYMEAAVHRELGPRDHHLVVPTIEIATGIAEKLRGGPVPDESEARLRKLTESLGIYTAKRYYNLLLAGVVGGEIPYPKWTSWDEGHHSTANTYTGLYDLLGRPPRSLWTATDYRGTPKETQELLESCNAGVFRVITLKEAVADGYVARPNFEVWPLLNDDLISVVNGEFVVRQVDSMIRDKMSELVERVGMFFDRTTGLWDRPTMLTFTSVAQVGYAETAFKAAGLPTVSVTGITRGRNALFEQVVSRQAVLLQINVVSEGVDLPIRRMLDLSPTLSPLRWMQRVGRITRPTGEHEAPPEYIACCHNLSRHAYLWHGLIPAGQIKKAQVVWGDEWKPQRRHLARAIGLEGFGRFAVSHIPLADGMTASFYGLQTKEGSDQYALFLHPLAPPVFFHRHNDWAEGEHVLKVLPSGKEIIGRKRKYARWSVIPKLPDLEGCVSLDTSPMSPGQAAMWKQHAAAFGLDPDANPDRRQFQLLPILRNTGLRIKPLAVEPT